MNLAYCILCINFLLVLSNQVLLSSRVMNFTSDDTTPVHKYITSYYMIFYVYVIIIPIPLHYAYFVQFDWLMNMCYTSINFMNRNLGTIFLPPAPNMRNNVNKNKILMAKLEL